MIVSISRFVVFFHIPPFIHFKWVGGGGHRGDVFIGTYCKNTHAGRSICI